MEAPKNAAGVEMKTQENRKPISIDSPITSENTGTSQGPAKPSKSATMPAQNGGAKLQSTGSVENGKFNKLKPAQAQEKPGFFSFNTGYFHSWQALLKLIKMVSISKMW